MFDCRSDLVLLFFVSEPLKVQSKCFCLWRQDEKICLLLLRLDVFFLKWNISLLCIGCICFFIAEYDCALSMYPMISGIHFFISLISIRIRLKLWLFLWLNIKLDVCWSYLVLSSFSAIPMYCKYPVFSRIFVRQLPCIPLPFGDAGLWAGRIFYPRSCKFFIVFLLSL